MLIKIAANSSVPIIPTITPIKKFIIVMFLIRNSKSHYRPEYIRSIKTTISPVLCQQ